MKKLTAEFLKILSYQLCLRGKKKGLQNFIFFLGNRSPRPNSQVREDRCFSLSYLQASLQNAISACLDVSCRHLLFLQFSTTLIALSWFLYPSRACSTQALYVFQRVPKARFSVSIKQHGSIGATSIYIGWGTSPRPSPPSPGKPGAEATNYGHRTSSRSRGHAVSVSVTSPSIRIHEYMCNTTEPHRLTL